MNISKADYEELVRLREIGCDFIIKFKGFPLPFGITGGDNLIFTKRKFGWIHSGYRQHIADAIAEYEREHKNDADFWPDWKKRAALSNYEFGKEDA